MLRNSNDTYIKEFFLEFGDFSEYPKGSVLKWLEGITGGGD
jgi:hypothetical protein